MIFADRDSRRDFEPKLASGTFSSIPLTRENTLEPSKKRQKYKTVFGPSNRLPRFELGSDSFEYHQLVDNGVVTAAAIAATGDSRDRISSSHGSGFPLRVKASTARSQPLSFLNQKARTERAI